MCFSASFVQFLMTQLLAIFDDHFTPCSIRNTEDSFETQTSMRKHYKTLHLYYSVGRFTCSTLIRRGLLAWISSRARSAVPYFPGSCRRLRHPPARMADWLLHLYCYYLAGACRFCSCRAKRRALALLE